MCYTTNRVQWYISLVWWFIPLWPVSQCRSELKSLVCNVFHLFHLLLERVVDRLIMRAISIEPKQNLPLEEQGNYPIYLQKTPVVSLSPNCKQTNFEFFRNTCANVSPHWSTLIAPFREQVSPELETSTKKTYPAFELLQEKKVAPMTGTPASPAKLHISPVTFKAMPNGLDHGWLCTFERGNTSSDSWLFLYLV